MKEGDDMSALQNPAQLNQPVHEGSKHEVKHEADNDGVRAMEEDGITMEEDDLQVRSVKEEEDAAPQEGFGDRKANDYLEALDHYEKDKIAHPGYQHTAPDLQGIPDYASKLER